MRARRGRSGWKDRPRESRRTSILARTAVRGRRIAEYAARLWESKSPPLAGLVKGYGETWRRGFISYTRIVDATVAPWLANGSLPANARLRRARKAASADPDGAALTATLDGR